MGGVDAFNSWRKKVIPPSPILVLDESMLPWKPRSTKTGGLPHLSYIPRKPNPFGTEFKVVADGAIDVFCGIEIQEGKKSMRNLPYVRQFGAICACTLRLLELCKESPVHYRVNSAEDEIDWLKLKRQLVIGDSWFSSVQTCVKVAKGGKFIYIKFLHTMQQVSDNVSCFYCTYI